MVGIFSFFRGHDRQLKLLIGAQAVLMAAHFAWLGAWAGVILALWGALRYGVSAYSQSRLFFWFFIIGGTALGIWRFESPLDVLPIIANCVACVAIFTLEGRIMRQVLLFSTFCWLGYNAAHGSIMGIMVEFFYLTANLTALWQNRKVKY